MASFQPSGALYDGNGVAPDVFVDRLNTDLVSGKTDTQLTAAITLIASSDR